MTDTHRTPLVSAIVSTYNAARFIRGCIEDLERQTIAEQLEIIVIDSASPQNEGEIVREFQERYPNIRYLRTEQRETVYAAWNRAISMARGRYITNANTDDRHRRDAFELMVKTMETLPDVDLVYADVLITQVPNETFETTTATDSYIWPAWDRNKLLHEGCFIGPQPMWRRSVHDLYGGFDPSYVTSGDYEFWLRISQTSNFQHVGQPLGLYLARPDSIEHTNEAAKQRENAKIRKIYQDAAVKGRLVGLLEQCPVQAVVRGASLLLKRGELVQAVQLLHHGLGVAADEPGPYVTLAELLIREGRFQDALNLLPEMPVAVDPALKMDLAAVCHSALGDDSAARQAASEAAGRPRALVVLGTLAARQGDLSEAERLFRQAVAADPACASGWLSLGMLWWGQGKHGEAFEAVKRAVTVDPLNQEAVQVLADMAERLGLQAAALEILESAAQAYPDCRHLDAQEWKQRYQSLFRQASAERKSYMLQRKRVVAVFSLDRQEFACSQLRLLGPLGRLADEYDIRWGAQVADAKCTTDLDAVQAADIIVVQRCYPRQGTLPFLEQMLATGKPVIYELDDLITDVPDDNHLKPWINETADLLPTLLPRFNAITVSTQALADVCKAYNPHVYVLPNLIDEQLWHANAKPTLNGPVVIGYTGTMTHASDIALLEPVLERLSAKYGDNVVFTFMGCTTERLSKLAGFQFIPFELSFKAYAKKLQNTPFDIMLAPLEDNLFNRCKSNIKWLEYSSCGIAGVYADLPPYNTCVKHGETGLLVGSDIEQWFEAICLLIEYPEYRKKMSEKARCEVLTHYSLQAKAQLWPQTYQKIIDTNNKKRSIKFSILILTWNRANMLDACLGALFSALKDRGVCEIIVGDNGSTDDTVRIVKKYPVDRYVAFDTNKGVDRYRELFEYAMGEYLICLDDDVIELPKGFEQEFERYFKVFPDYGLLGLNVVQNALTNGAKPEEQYYREDRRGPLVVEEGFVIGCCMCISRNIFNQIGGFGDRVLTMWMGDDAILYNKVKVAGLRAGILQAVTCLHACGPQYAKMFGYLEREIEKYRANDMADVAATYEALQQTCEK